MDYVKAEEARRTAKTAVFAANRLREGESLLQRGYVKEHNLTNVHTKGTHMAARLDTREILQKGQTLINQAVDRGTTLRSARSLQ